MTTDEANFWKLENIDLMSWLFSQDDDNLHAFLADMQVALKKYGYLTERQTAAVRKWMNGAERAISVKRAEDEATKDAPKLEGGRRNLTGEILSVKWTFGDYGDQLKMNVRLADGNRVYGTCPASLREHFTDEQLLVGKRISFTAMVTPKDDHFGFFRRPSAASLV